jgi:hypothetical protein
MLLFWLFVLAGLGTFTTAKAGTLCNCINVTAAVGNMCSKYPILEFTQNNTALFWAALGVTIFRVVFGFTYGNYIPTIRELAIKERDVAWAKDQISVLVKQMSEEKPLQANPPNIVSKDKEEEELLENNEPNSGRVQESAHNSHDFDLLGTDVFRRIQDPWAFSPAQYASTDQKERINFF